MNSNSFVPVESYSNSIEAELAKNCLNDAGVVAIVEGTNAATTLSYIGSALAGVRVLVQVTDFAKAQGILNEFRECKNTASRDFWYCGPCNEKNEPSFDLCWKCGMDRSAVEATRIAKPDTSNSPLAFEGKKTLLDGQTGRSDQAVQTTTYVQGDVPSTSKDLNELTAEEAEEMVQRAWRAAMLGTFIPLFLSIYSIVLLLSSLDTSSPLSAKGKRLRLQAWVANIVLLLFSFLFVSSLFY